MKSSIVDKSYLDKFKLENRAVIKMLQIRMEAHNQLMSMAYNELRKEVLNSKNTRDESYVISGEISRISVIYGLELTERDYMLAQPAPDVKELMVKYFKDKIGTSYSKGFYGENNSDAERFIGEQNFSGIDIFGDISRVGEEYRVSIKEEFEGRLYKNEILGRNMLNIEDMVYVSRVYGNYDNDGIDDYNGNPTKAIRYSHRAYAVEFDALLIRYLSSLDEEELKTTIDSILTLVADRYYRLFMTIESEFRLTKDVIVMTVNSNSVSKRDLYMTYLIAKVISDGVNGSNVVEDNKSVKEIVDLADMSLRNSGSIFNISNTGRLMMGVVGRKYGRPKILERDMDLILEFIENEKFNIMDNLNKFKKFSLSKNSMAMRRYINKNTLYHATESCENLDKFMAYANESEAKLDREFCMFSVLGMESNEDKLAEYRRKSRSVLMSSLDSSERRRYLNLENEILRYQSDAINAKTDARKNVLLSRSKTISKLINLEMNNTSNDKLLTLISLLEEKKYDIDNTLSSRDFNRERNTRIYGQIVPSGDWDY